MPTPISKGNVAFREVSADETLNRSGLDSLSVVLRGARAGLAAERNKWQRGSKYAGYPNMFLETRSSLDKGPVAEITLNFVGSLSSQVFANGVIDRSDSITRQSVSLTTSTGENVSLQYFAQQNTTRWMSYSAQAPRSPRFGSVVPTSIPVTALFSPDPPNFKGSLSNAFQPVGRLAQFDRQELSPGVWMVVESWEVMVDPISQNP